MAPGGRLKEERKHEHSLRRPQAATQSPRPNRSAFAPTGGGHQGRATAGGNRDERRRAGPGRRPLWGPATSDRTHHYATAVQMLGQGVLTPVFLEVFRQLGAHLVNR